MKEKILSYVVNVTYPRELYCDVMEHKILEATKKHAESAGMEMFPGGKRDMQFFYRNKQQAVKAYNALKIVDGIKVDKPRLDI